MEKISNKTIKCITSRHIKCLLNQVSQDKCKMKKTKGNARNECVEMGTKGEKKEGIRSREDSRKGSW